MTLMLHWLEASLHNIPLILLESWGRFSYVLGIALALLAFGGFTFRVGDRWSFGRERQAWDAKALLSIPLTFVIIVVSGYLGSSIVLVPGAQTLESLKDLCVFLCVTLFGYPALWVVPFAYALSDMLEGVPPEFLVAWLPGYFINPSFFWIAYQLIGKCPDFRRSATWLKYLGFVASFLVLEPVLWGSLHKLGLVAHTARPSTWLTFLNSKPCVSVYASGHVQEKGLMMHRVRPRVSDARAKSKSQSRTNIATHCWFCAGLSLLSACSGSGGTKPWQLEAADAGETDKPHAQKVSWTESANHKADEGGAARVLSVRAVVPGKVTAGDTFRVVCELRGDTIPMAESTLQPHFEPDSAVEHADAGTFRALHTGKVQVRCDLDAAMVQDRQVESSQVTVEIAPSKLATLETQLDHSEVQAGAVVRVRCLGRDTYGNETSDSEITHEITPGAMGNSFDADKLRVEHAGDYEVLCQHPRALVQGAKLKVKPGLPSSLKLQTAPYHAEYPPGESVKITAAASDMFGNAVPDVEIALDVPPDVSEKVSDDTYRFSEGTHAIHAQVRSSTLDGRPVETTLDLHVDGGAPRITCDEPLDGSSLATVLDHVALRGRVADGSGIAEVDINGTRVTIADGKFEQDVPISQGLNFVDVKAVDGVGTPNHQLCSFTVSDLWSTGNDMSTVRVQLGQRALDDAERDAPASSIADMLYTAMSSASFRDAIDAKLKEHADLKPSTCDESVLDGCIMRTSVQYLGLELGGPHQLALALIDGGIQVHANLHDVRLHTRAYGMVTGIDFDSTGWVSMDNISADAILDTAASGGRPRVSIRDDSVHTQVDSVSTDFSNIDGAVINLLADLFNGSLRSELTSAIDDVINHQLGDALADVLGGLDVNALGTTLHVPKLSGGGEVAAELSFTLRSLNATSERLQAEIGTHVQGSASDGSLRPLPGLGYPRRIRSNATLVGDQTMAIAIDEVLVTQLVQALWQGGLLEASIAPGEVPELPKALSGQVSFDAPPIAELNDGRVVLSAGSVAIELNYPGLFGKDPVRARAGVRASAALQLENARIALHDYKIDDLRFGTDRRDLEGAQDPMVRASIIRLIDKQLRPTLERALLSIPIPTLAIPSVLVGAGFSDHDRLGVREPMLQVQAPQGVVTGNFGVVQ